MRPAKKAGGERNGQRLSNLCDTDCTNRRTSLLLGPICNHFQKPFLRFAAFLTGCPLRGCSVFAFGTLMLIPFKMVSFAEV